MKRRMNRAVLFLSLLVLVCFVAGVSGGYAAAPKAVMGYIQDVTSTTIKVSGHTYDITGVPLFHKNGARVSRDLLQKGNMVEILFENGKITRIVINNTRLPQ